MPHLSSLWNQAAGHGAAELPAQGHVLDLRQEADHVPHLWTARAGLPEDSVDMAVTPPTPKQGGVGDG